ENRLLVEKLRQEKLPAILDALLEAQINAILKNYFDQIKTGLEIFSERHLIFRHRDLQNLIPKSSTVDVPFRLLIVEEIFPSLSTAHGNLTEEIRKQIEELLRDVSEIDQIVEYNLDTALNMLKERKDSDIATDAHSVAIEGLERSINKIQELIDKNKKMGDQIRESLFQTSFDYISHIQDLADNEKVNQLQLRFARAKAKEKLRNYRVLLWNKLKEIFSRAKKWSINILQRSITLYSRLRKITGLAPTEKEVEVKLATFLTDTQKRIASLPFVYHRLFRKEPISDERFFAGRTRELSEFENAFTEWQSGQYAVTAIVGEKGSGKTTLFNLAEQKFLLNVPIIKINLTETTIFTEEKLYELLVKSFDAKESKTMNELENRLRDENDRKICIFENIQNLFIRTVDGFDALERFLLFISRTDKTIFWLISCTLYSWNYLDKVVQISKLCKNMVNLGALEQQEVESIILKRHRISGYQLHFDLPESVTQSRQFKKLKNEDQQQKFLMDMYFDQLNKLSAGNITVAMSFWLSAIREISENRMVLWPTIDLDYSFLYQLSSDELFTLAAMLQHETLEAEEHALIFHQNIQQSLLLLNQLKTKRIIVDVEDRYQIHHLLYRPVVAVLKSKNIIH
ncbi:MAG: AAA family ATPase, partial [bacterium]